MRRRKFVLPVPHYRQPNSYTCVAASIKALLEYSGKRTAFQKIRQGVQTVEPSGTDIFHAAIYCAKQNMRPCLYLFDPQWTLPRYKSLSRKEILKVIKRRRNDGWPWGHLHTLIAEGGAWHPRGCAPAVIRSLLKRNVPVIVAVNAKCRPFAPVNGSQDHPHVVVAVGFTATHLLYLDPQNGPTVKKISWKNFSRLNRRELREALFFQP